MPKLTDDQFEAVMHKVRANYPHPWTESDEAEIMNSMEAVEADVAIECAIMYEKCQDPGKSVARDIRNFIKEIANRKNPESRPWAYSESDVATTEDYKAAFGPVLKSLDVNPLYKPQQNNKAGFSEKAKRFIQASAAARVGSKQAA